MIDSSIYYPFGSIEYGRQYASKSYRYGFGHMEKDNEIGGDDNVYTTHHRMYDSRLGRWFSIDPEFSKFPNWTPYCFSFDNPIIFNDPTGDVPPTLKEIITTGKASATFNILLTGAGISETNPGAKISYVDPAPTVVTGTDIFTGKITLVKEENLHTNVINLVHELTNSKNTATFQQIYSDMETGKISPEQFADKLLSTETEGVLNQVIVASELNVKFPDELVGMNQFLDFYKQGVPKEKIHEVMKKMQGELINPQTQKNLKQGYMEDGKKIREDYLKKHPPTNESEQKKEGEKKEPPPKKK